jgi:hypothetical protein
VKKSLSAFVCATSLFAYGSASSAWAADRINIQPGKWQLTVSMEMEGQPQRPPQVLTKCEQAQDIPTPETLMGKTQHSTVCKSSDFRTTRDKASWTFACQNGAKGSGEIVYGGDTYAFTMHMSMQDKKRGEMKMTQHINGKRLGAC